MTDQTTEAPSAEKPEPPAGLYVFYDDQKEVQVGVSGDYTIAEAVYILGAAKAKLELLQYLAYRAEHERQTTKSPIYVPH